MSYSLVGFRYTLVRASTSGVVTSPVQMVMCIVFARNTSFNFLIMCRRGSSSKFPLLMLKDVNSFSFTTSSKYFNEFNKFSVVIGTFLFSFTGKDIICFPES